MVKKHILQKPNIITNIIIDEKYTNEFKLQSPFALFVAGCTGSGKTVTVLNWLKNVGEVFQNNFTKIYYFHGSRHQDIFNEPKLKHVTFSNNMKFMQKITETFHKSPGILVILDDLMSDTSDSDFIQKLYTKGSHHLNINIINIVQSIFYKAKYFTLMKDNSQYTFVKLHVNDIKLKLLSNALGVETNEFMEAYTESINYNRFGGILIDNHVKSNIRKLCKIRDNLTNGVGLYIPDSKLSYHINKGTLVKYNENAYFLDFKKLNDECTI